MGFIYQEANAYGVEALVALERHYTPTEEKYCTAVTEAVRICDTYGIPERELVPQVRHIAAAEEYLLEHLSEDEETLQFLFTPLSGSNTCLAWFLVWDYVRPGGEKAYKYTGHTPQQRLRDIISAVGQYQEDPLPPSQQLDTICDLIDYMDLTRLPPADRWRLLTLYAHLEEYERTACRIVEQSAALLAQVMQTPETDRLLRQCLEQTRENTPRLMSAFAQSQTLSDQSITFLPCVMSFNSMRFLTGDDHITVIAGVLYWLILRLTEKYAANDEHLLACLKTLGDKSRLDILKLLKRAGPQRAGAGQGAGHLPRHRLPPPERAGAGRIHPYRQGRQPPAVQFGPGGHRVHGGRYPPPSFVAKGCTTPSEKTAAKVQQTLLRRQATVQSRLGRSLRQEQVDYTYSYTMLFNGFALRTARKNLETIQSTKGVSRAFVAGSYTLPTVEQADTQALQVALATNQFTGKGMTIAVLEQDGKTYMSSHD